MFNDNGSFLLALFEFFIFFAWLMCVFYVFGDIFRSHDMGGGAKTLWCLFVIFVPFLGILVYLIARGGGMTERAMEQQQRDAATSRLSTCVQSSPRAAAARAPIRSRRPNNSSTRERSPRPSSTS